MLEIGLSHYVRCQFDNHRDDDESQMPMDLNSGRSINLGTIEEVMNLLNDFNQ